MRAQANYERELAKHPTYNDGTPRKTWDQLDAPCRATWEPLTREQVYAQLPNNAYWSCSFGNPGEGGFNEYYRTPDGQRYRLSNGTWDGGGNEWSIERVHP